MNTSSAEGASEKFQAPLSAASRLRTLQSQMAASSYGADHPWRIALAEISSAIEPSGHGDGIAPVRKQAYEIESRIGNIAILVEAIFDRLDGMSCDTPELHKVANAINCFANSAMESAQAIRSANEQILTLTSGGVQ